MFFLESDREALREVKESLAMMNKKIDEIHCKLFINKCCNEESNEYFVNASNKDLFWMLEKIEERLEEIEKKIDLGKLNEMILELKGCVAMTRASLPKKKKEKKEL